MKLVICFKPHHLQTLLLKNKYVQKNVINLYTYKKNIIPLCIQERLYTTLISTYKVKTKTKSTNTQIFKLIIIISEHTDIDNVFLQHASTVGI